MKDAIDIQHRHVSDKAISVIFVFKKQVIHVSIMTAIFRINGRLKRLISSKGWNAAWYLDQMSSVVFQ